MGNKQLFLVFCLYLAQMSSSHAGAPTTAKPAEVLQLHPVSISSTGNVIARASSHDDVYAWDASTSTQKPLFISEGTMSPSYYGAVQYPPKIDISSDGKTLLSLQNIATPPYTQLLLMDQTSNQKHVIAETRVIAAVPRFSPDGQNYAFVGKLDANNYYQGQSLWTLDVVEYLWDLGWGIAQPTGYYLQTVHAGNTPPPNGYANPDTIGGFAWSSDGQKLAYSLTKYDSRGAAKTALYIHDRATQKTEEVTSIGWAIRLDWPTGDYIFFLSQQYNNATGYYTYQLSRLDIKTKTTRNVISDSLDPNSYSITPDGKYILYSQYVAPQYPPVAQAPQPAILYEVDTKTRIELSDVQSGSVGPSDNLILQKQKVDAKTSAKPFYVVDIKELVAGATQNQQLKKVTVGSVSKVNETGEAVVVYEPPTDSAEFGAEFTMAKPVFQMTGNYFYGSARFQNVSKQYYKFKFASYNFLRCKLYDDKGVEVGNNDNAFPPLPAGYENTMTFGPNKTTNPYCNGTVSTRPSVGTKGKVVMEFHGYEGRGKYEADINF